MDMKKFFNHSTGALVVFLLITTCAKSQPDYFFPAYFITQGSYSNPWMAHPGSIVTESSSSISTTITATHNSKVEAHLSIELKPGFETFPDASSSSNGYIDYRIQGSKCDVVITNSIDALIPKHHMVEIGVDLSDLLSLANDAIQNFFYNTHPLDDKINPYAYDPAIIGTPGWIRVVGLFTSPSGVVKSVDAFYYKDYWVNSSSTWDQQNQSFPFRIRFAPDEEGDWLVEVKIYSSVGDYASGSLFIDPCSASTGNGHYFTCTPSNDKGYLEVGNYNYLRFKDTHESFFAIGENIAHPFTNGPANHFDYEVHRNYLHQLKDAGANYARLFLVPTANHIEQEQLGNYDGGQCSLWELDKTFDQIYNDNIYLHFTIESCNEFCYVSQYNFPFWDNNPYNSNCSVGHDFYPPLVGVNSVGDFFLSNDAKKFYAQKLHYLAARYGYSTHLAVYELFNELDHIGLRADNDPTPSGYDNIKNTTILRDWHQLMIAFMKNVPGNENHLYSTGFAGNGIDNPYPDNIPYPVASAPNMDIATAHDYGNQKFQDYGRFDVLNPIGYLYNPLTHRREKPGLLGEVGTKSVREDPNDENSPSHVLEECTDLCVHNTIWATSFQGGYGCGLLWDWIVDHAHGYQDNFVALKSFTDLIDFENHQFFAHQDQSHEIFSYNGDPILEYFYLKDGTENRFVGWYHNTTSYWASFWDINCMHNWFQIPSDDLNPGYIIPSHHVYLRFHNLTWHRKYDYSCFRTPHNAPVSLYSSTSKRVNVWGDLNFDVQDPLQFHKDMAFIILKHGVDLRSVDTLETDTLSCPNDTIYANGIYEDDTLGLFNYYWDFGNGLTSNLWHPYTYYNAPGTYTVTVIVSDSTFSDTLIQQFVVLDCSLDSSESRMNFDTYSSLNFNIIVYPNPSTGKINISIFSPANNYNTCRIYDAFGKLILLKSLQVKKGINTFTEDFSFLPTGIYSIVASDNTDIKNIKFVLNK
jgi:hypothetical protein